MTMMADHFTEDEPQRIYNWYLEIPGLGQEVKMHVESVKLPTFGTAVLKERYFNEDIKVAGAAVVTENQIVVRDTITRSAYKKINEWAKKVHDPKDGRIGFATEYKKEGTLKLTAPDGSNVRDIICKGMWPSMLAGSDLTYQSEAGDVKIQMVLQVDKYLLDGI